MWNGISVPAALALNVRDFGAVGDGVTDDSAAFQAAINEAQTTATALFIPGSTTVYRATNLLITKPIKIYGAGKFQSVVRNKIGVATPLLTLQRDSSYYLNADFAELSDFQLRGEKDDATGLNVAHNLVLSNGTDGFAVILRNMMIARSPGDGVSATAFSGWAEFHSTDILDNKRDGVSATSCNDWRWFGGEIGVNARDNLLVSGCNAFQWFGTAVYSATRMGFNFYNDTGNDAGGHTLVGVNIDRNGDHGLRYDMRNGGMIEVLGCGLGLNGYASSNTKSDVYIEQLAGSGLSIVAPRFQKPFPDDATHTSKSNIEFHASNTTAIVKVASETLFGRTFASTTFTNSPSQIYLMGDASAGIRLRSTRDGIGLRGKVSAADLPASSAGLSSGDLWVDTGAGNVVKRV
jgi:hypothetical protein